jgi:hypothetical protein
MPMTPCAACGAFTRAHTRCPHCGAAAGASPGLAVAVLLGLSSCGLFKTDNQYADYGNPPTDTDWSDVDTDVDTDTDSDTADSGGSGGP